MVRSGKRFTPRSIRAPFGGLFFEVIMKYRVTQPFIAFGKTPQPGEIVELTQEQAALLAENDCIADYETKVMPPPQNKAKKKPLRASQAAPVARKKTRKKSAKSVKK